MINRYLGERFFRQKRVLSREAVKRGQHRNTLLIWRIIYVNKPTLSHLGISTNVVYFTAVMKWYQNPSPKIGRIGIKIFIL